MHRRWAFIWFVTGVVYTGVTVMSVPRSQANENREVESVTGSKIARLLLDPGNKVVLSQQEVDPTWHDPWATPDKVVSQAPKPGAPQPKKNQRISTKAKRGRSGRPQVQVRPETVGLPVERCQACQHPQTK